MRHDERVEHFLERIARNTECLVDGLETVILLLTPPTAVSAVLSTDTGGTMTTAVLTFTDQSGTAIAPPKGDGSGLDVTFSSDNPAVTVATATAAGDLATAAITGTEAFNLSATVANVSGAPLLDDDGVTEFVQPSPLAVAATTPVDQAVTVVLSTE